MAINLCRYDPKKFAPYVKKVYESDAKLRKGKHKASLVKLMEKFEGSLPQLTIS